MRTQGLSGLFLTRLLGPMSRGEVRGVHPFTEAFTVVDAHVKDGQIVHINHCEPQAQAINIWFHTVFPFYS